MKRTKQANASRGQAAWANGHLDLAVALLEPLVQGEEAPLEVIYPLARTYSERGDRDAALALLARAMPGNAPATGLLRAEILFDHGPADQAQQELQALAASNPIAAGLLAVLKFQSSAEGPQDDSVREISLPRAARWMSSVMGRLLAALEMHLLAAGEEKFTSYHTRALLPEPPESDDPLEQALLAANLKEVIRICRQEEKPVTPPPGLGKVRFRLRQLFGRVKSYPRVYCQWMMAFAQTLLGQEAESTRAISSALEEGDARMDFLLLAGLHHVRCGRRRQAGVTFACTARLGDVVVSDNIDALAKHLNIAIRLCD